MLHKIYHQLIFIVVLITYFIQLMATIYISIVYSISIISGQVTWLRTMDSTVLSVGADTFSSDTRLAVVHVARSVHSVSGHTWIFPHPVTRGQTSTPSRVT